jgi:hypothetical protein
LLNESLTAETIDNVTRNLDAGMKYYLAMNIDSNNDLTVNITDETLYSYQENSPLLERFCS